LISNDLKERPGGIGAVLKSLATLDQVKDFFGEIISHKQGI
jgi:hypothetical protein